MKMLRMVLLILLWHSVAAAGRRRPLSRRSIFCSSGKKKATATRAVSHAIATIERLGRETEFVDHDNPDGYRSADEEKLEYNAKNLNDFDAVLFYTGGKLEMNPEQKAALLRSSTRMEKVSRRPQAAGHHLHGLAGVRRNDWRILRRTSLGHL